MIQKIDFVKEHIILKSAVIIFYLLDLSTVIIVYGVSQNYVNRNENIAAERLLLSYFR
jgi:positive regulator of sigma E activity